MLTHLILIRSDELCHDFHSNRVLDCVKVFFVVILFNLYIQLNLSLSTNFSSTVFYMMYYISNFEHPVCHIWQLFNVQFVWCIVKCCQEPERGISFQTVTFHPFTTFNSFPYNYMKLSLHLHLKCLMLINLFY